MKGTIYLARHASHAEVGRILSGRSEIGLNDQGQAEARGLAERLAQVPLAAVHTSPRRRAVETARIVAEARGIPLRQAAALDEIDFGTWSGRSFAMLDEDPAWRHWNEARATAATPAGETMQAAIARARDHLAAIAEDGPVLCVSHCDIIRGVVAALLGMPLDRLLAFDCDPAALTILAWHDGGARLVTLNERPR